MSYELTAGASALIDREVMRLHGIITLAHFGWKDEVRDTLASVARAIAEPMAAEIEGAKLLAKNLGEMNQQQAEEIKELNVLLRTNHDLIKAQAERIKELETALDLIEGVNNGDRPAITNIVEALSGRKED